MAIAPGVDLVLFVTGEPDPGLPSTRDVTLSVGDRIWGSFVPLGLMLKSPTGPLIKPGQGPPYSAESALPPEPKGDSWRLPPQQIQCVNAVVDLARRERRTLTIVDVDRAGARQPLVDRWVGSDDILPILVRPDGARLEGLENFGPRQLRRFIHRP